MRQRPSFIPVAWRKVTSGNGLESFDRRRDARLVLDARDIPFIISHFRGQEHIYVPPLQEKMARTELGAYQKENAPAHPKIPHFPIYRDCALSALFLAPLFIWHILAKAWRPPIPFLPNPASWTALGEVNPIKIRFHGEWWRTGTALTLHANAGHLVSNMAFGALFLALLARIAGIGRAFFLTVLGGMAGNAISMALHPLTYKSIGFSTALFACVGALSTLTICRVANRKKRFMAIAAGLALLAMLGTEGENTDYGAHLAGLFAGCLLGFHEGWRVKHSVPGLSQFQSGFAGVALLALCWIFAFWRGNAVY